MNITEEREKLLKSIRARELDELRSKGVAKTRKNKLKDCKSELLNLLCTVCLLLKFVLGLLLVNVGLALAVLVGSLGGCLTGPWKRVLAH